MHYTASILLKSEIEAENIVHDILWYLWIIITFLLCLWEQRFSSIAAHMRINGQVE